MATWTCPRCGRRFGRASQAHECAPALTLDEYLADGPPWEAPVVHAVLGHLEGLGDVIIEPVGIGVLVKRSRTFVELRAMARWEAVWFVLPRTLAHPRVTRRMVATSSLTAHAVRVRTPDEVDDQLRAWLTESWLAAA